MRLFDPIRDFFEQRAMERELQNLGPDQVPGGVYRCVARYLQSSQWKKIEPLLQYPHKMVRFTALSAMMPAAAATPQGNNMNSLLPALVRLMEDSDYLVRAAAGFLVSKEAGRRTDLSIIIPALRVHLRSAQVEARTHAANALTLDAVNQKDWMQVVALVAHENPAVQFGALDALVGVSRDTAPKMQSTMEVSGLSIAIANTLQSEHAEIREKAATVLLLWIMQGAFNLAGLERMEQVIECAFQNRQKKTPAHQQALPDTIATRLQMVRLLQLLAEKKARMAKEKDGEMLAGETIARPKNRKGIFRTALQRA